MNVFSPIFLIYFTASTAAMILTLDSVVLKGLLKQCRSNGI